MSIFFFFNVLPLPSLLNLHTCVACLLDTVALGRLNIYLNRIFGNVRRGALSSRERCVEQMCSRKVGGTGERRGRRAGARGGRGLGGRRVRLAGRREKCHVSAPATPAAVPERASSEVLPVPLYHPDSAAALGPEHLSQCQNLTLYRSFCAMKYAIYALCVNSHQHTQCQECKDSPSEDLAMAAEPVNDSVSSGTAPPSLV